MVYTLGPFSTLAIVAIISNCLTLAHNEPKTEDEIRDYIDSQRSIYHCYPEILSQVEQRKAMFAKTSSGAQLVDQTATATASKLQTLEFGSSGSDHPPDHPFLESPSNLVCTQRHSSAKISKIRNSTCVLSPIVTAGPYYHQEGHPIRQDIAEWQDGLPLALDIGVIDVETCKPVRGVLVDIWHANATGFYGGHPNPAKGFENEKPQVGGVRGGLLTGYPRDNYDEQWLRGAWPTDKNGVARFNTIFPGYYTGRATHIHAEVHTSWDMTSNGTFNSKDVQYVGQFFFDDEINMSVDKMWPYNQNPVEHRTRNWRDSLRIFHNSKVNGFQPTLDIIKAGSVINQGLVGFMTVGINLSHRYDHHHNPKHAYSDFD
ncbi:hypothetical protein MJO29_012185 [Puccinia striiformis f. sp. tritici]|uniref:Intradiol ring-cleavage dioxygenases domain-containing protein n=1 Tax=Puccinia striiformis f. sp. tritici PST-78 TaxID=1165861 RepID=A0A0L0VD16_9BASI|nr:hypothetical protein Pst134EA_022871 [Puccinia striiformis f. sp. tritici]KAI9606014.1 hypothetical protein H4Q26_004386 [Puccinia striiformis f. sp. tritici PST-130]KNE97183.1 hypothetical protein PSTG_09608 [Puccinia striiformis f. sp. tritici PST-78]KAH9445909.1 hypothetical protein Pst134EB_023740 [Puccinia striiformis f. sp. tritici]KAH9455403.1 hypothetical protein Pst134EA_022871 [Puccinia striiformis f. sp. tritici]KAI7945797.1 hypothetical protein MJO29_012185 [Puccinia striiformis